MHLQNWWHLRFNDSVLKVEMTESAVTLDVGYKKMEMTPSILAWATRRIKLPLTEDRKGKEEQLGRWKGEGPLGVLNYNVCESSKGRCGVGSCAYRLKREAGARNRTLRTVVVLWWHLKTWEWMKSEEQVSMERRGPGTESWGSPTSRSLRVRVKQPRRQKMRS